MSAESRLACRLGLGAAASTVYAEFMQFLLGRSVDEHFTVYRKSFCPNEGGLRSVLRPACACQA